MARANASQLTSDCGDISIDNNHRVNNYLRRIFAWPPEGYGPPPSFLSADYRAFLCFLFPLEYDACRPSVPDELAVVLRCL